MHGIGLVVGVFSVLFTGWVVTYCGGTCATLVNTYGLGSYMVFAPIVVPLLCALGSAILCIPDISDRRRRGVWVITWTGFGVVALDFLLMTG